MNKITTYILLHHVYSLFAIHADLQSVKQPTSSFPKMNIVGVCNTGQIY